ncbi:hypothetical protein MG290_06400 [Flavobacterium sp. CBA20B-1]|uniref:hypothetical protein n=1 Tax=unclassified Flavobacterium TaxID=196869 RepID=UPI0022246B6C|nr:MULTISPECIES: hypothetical protein [unclassified Flavobacterium]WCM43286.1 hypothetical protein MG290_06400 [Flavobacterium sp. CBA20B-1]
MKKIGLLVVLMALVIACTAKTEPVSTAFYFWRTTFALSPAEQNSLTDLQVKKLYIRYFDIGLQNKEPIPVAPIVFNESPKKYQVVPVVYIKNEVFLQTTQTDSLAEKVYHYIQQINQSADVSVNEIQFDCDWSLQSKQNYFQFLEAFKKWHPNVTATIRLHQIKYPEKTGIPPVKNGVLMYYNMGVIGSDNENSIYSQKIAQKYVASLQNYKLPLNIALPVFSWGVHVRNNQITNLIGGLRVNDLTGDEFKKISENRFKVLKDVVFKGRYLAKDDEIKIEAVSANQLKEMMHDIKQNSKHKPNEIIFYDLNENNLKAYENKDFKTVSSW